VIAVNRVDRYIFRQLLVATVFVAVTLTCVVWLTQSLRFVEMIVNRGLSAPLFVYLTLLLLPTFLSVILPVALFAAVLFTYNKLLIDSELLVMRAGGLSHMRLGRGALALALIITALCYAITIYFMPASYREFKELQFTLRNSYPSVLLQEGVFNTLGDGLTVYVRERAASGELFGIIIHDSRNRKRPITMMAQRGTITTGPKGPRVIMATGNRQEINEKDGRLSLLYFDRYTFDFGTSGQSIDERWREPRERFLHELFFPRSQETTLWGYHKFRMEGHHRLSAPLLPMSFTLLALALLLYGDFNRRGQLWRILSAVGIVLLMETSLLGVKNMGEKLYVMPLLPAAVALWALTASRPVRRRAAVASAG
jgi:lipopolysaccharide export system permease protein